MKKFFLFIGILLSVFGCKNTVDSKKSLLIPAYFYDSNLWEQIEKNDFSGVVIVNPNSGVGNYSSYYDEIIKKIQNKNPVGYIYTKYGERNLDDVKNEIDKWTDYYKIKGFFFDEVNESRFNYYQALYRYVKNKGDYKVVLNPGCNIDERFFNIADIIVIFENGVSEFNKKVCAGTFSDKRAAIVYNASYNDFIKYKDCGCKYIYFTNDTLPNPYDTLPSYFDREIKEIK